MAFDMSVGDQHECIRHSDEFLFSLAEAQRDKYPQLFHIWGRFYDDPRLSPAQSGELVHELIELLAAHGGPKNTRLAAVVSRLSSFFSMAQQSGHEVECVSD